MFFIEGHATLTGATRCRTVVTHRTVVQMSGIGKSGLQYPDDLFLQLWGVRRGRLPYDLPINREVRMDRDIAKADDVAPWRLGKTSAQGHRNAGRRLTDDRQLVKHGAAHEIVVQETLGIDIGDKGGNRIRCFDNIHQVQPVTPHTEPRCSGVLAHGAEA